MGTAITAGRVVGALILAQLVSGVLMNFVLTTPAFDDTGFLAAASPHAEQIGLSALLGIATGALFVAMAITAFPVLRPRSQGMAIWLIAVAVACLAVAAIEQLSVMSMVSLSEAYAKASPVEHDQFQALGGVVAAARRWAHYLGRIADGCVLFVLYAAMYRFGLIPRAFAGFGVVAVILQLAAVAMPFFGHDVLFPLLAPLGLCQLALASWLIIKGFHSQTNAPLGAV